MINYSYMRSSNCWQLGCRGLLSNICLCLSEKLCWSQSLSKRFQQELKGSNESRKERNKYPNRNFLPRYLNFPKTFSLKLFSLRFFYFSLLDLNILLIGIFSHFFLFIFYLFPWFSSFLYILHSFDCNMQMRLKVMLRNQINKSRVP